MRIISIDPGYDRMGVAIINQEAGREKLQFSGCYSSTAKLPFSERLHGLGGQVEALIKDWQPEVMAIERLFFTKNQKTASAVAEVRGMLLYLAGKHNLKVWELTPLEIKQCITGFGGASKDQVMRMTEKLISFTSKPKYDDEYDAVAIGLAALAQKHRFVDEVDKF